MKRFGSEMAYAGKALTAAITLPLVGVAVAAVHAANQFEEAEKTIRAGTGATGKELEDLVKTFRTVNLVVPNAMKDVGTAIADVATRTGATGKQLESLSTQMLNLARLTKSEVKPLVAATTRAFGDWSISTANQGKALDHLFKVSQKTGIALTNLTETLVYFGAPLRTLGYSFEEGAALLGKWEKEGVNLETILAGLRFALAKFAAAGREPRQAMKEVTEAIRGAKTESQATAIAFDAFGKRAAVDMSRAIIEGRFQIDGLVQSLQESSETIDRAAKDNMKFAERLALLKKEAQALLEPLGKALIDALEGLMEAMKPALKGFQDMAKAFAALSPEAKRTYIEIAAITAALPLAILAIGTAIEKIMLITLAVNRLAGALGLSKLALLGWMAAIPVALLAVYEGIKAANQALQEHKAAMDASRAVAEKAASANKKLADSIEYQERIARRQSGQAIARAGELLEAQRRLSDFAGALDRLRPGVAWAEAYRKTTSEAAEAIDDLAVKTERMMTLQELLAKEIKDRGAAAIKKAVDAIADWLSISKPWGEKLELHAAQIDDLAFRLKLFQSELERVGQAQIKMAEQPDWSKVAKGTYLETLAILKRLGVVTREQRIAAAEAAGEDFVRLVELRDLGEATQGQVDAARKKYEDLSKAIDGSPGQIARVESAWRQMGKEIQSAMRHMVRGIADIIVAGGKMGKVFVDVAKRIAAAILEIIILQAIKSLIKHLGFVLDHLGAIGKALKDWAGAAAEVTKATAKVTAATGGAAAAGGGGGAAGGGGGTLEAIGGGIISAGATIGVAYGEAIRDWQIAKWSELMLTKHMNNLCAWIEWLGKTAIMNAASALVGESAASTNALLGGLNNIWQAIKEGGGSSGAPVTINIYESKSARDTAQEVVTLLKRQGIVPATA